MSDQPYSEDGMTEYQRQGAAFLLRAIHRLYQEGMSQGQVAKLFVSMTETDLEKFGMKLVLFVGIPDVSK